MPTSRAGFPSGVKKKNSIAVKMAAGSTIKKFVLNLSFISQPCVLTAAIVVSDTIDRLSPNIAPQTTAAMQIARGKPAVCAIPAPIGANAAIVPTEVPIDVDIKQAMMKRPTTANFPGSMDKNRLTVLLTPPAAETIPENAPATRNIRHIITMFSSDRPLAHIFIFCSKLSSLC